MRGEEALRAQQKIDAAMLATRRIKRAVLARDDGAADNSDPANKPPKRKTSFADRLRRSPSKMSKEAAAKRAGLHSPALAAAAAGGGGAGAGGSGDEAEQAPEWLGFVGWNWAWS